MIVFHFNITGYTGLDCEVTLLVREYIFNILSFTIYKRKTRSHRAHVAKFYGRLRLIRSVWRASKLSVFKIDRNCNFVGLLHHPFWLQFILAPFGHYFSTFKIALFG